jgi:hypothetical protein
MDYHKKIENLKKAHSAMKDTFMKFAVQKSLSQTEIETIFKMFEEVVREKKCHYDMDYKISKINNKIEKIFNIRTTSSKIKKEKTLFF